MQERVTAGQAAVASDQLALAKAQASGAGEAQARQILAADQAALQADRMMQYTVEDFARADPNPAVTAAENKVDGNRRLIAEAVATRARDKNLAHGLMALWVLVAGTAVLAWRGRGADENANGEDEDNEDDEDDEGDSEAEDDEKELDDLFAAEDREI